MCGCFFGEYSNLATSEGCLTHFVGKSHCLHPINLRTIQPQIFEKIKNSQLELKFTGSYL